MTEQDVLNTAVKFCEKNKRFPTMIELAELGVSRAKIRQEFGNLGTLLRRVAGATKSVFDLNLTPPRFENPSVSKKRFIISTAVTGAEVDKKFFASISTYCKKLDAQLLVLVSHNTKSGLGTPIDPLLRDSVIVTTDCPLNNNVFLLGIKNAAKSSDPITGLPRIGKRNGTFIAASPKQRLRMVPTGQHRLPHALMSTGALTKPSYISDVKFINKNDYLADADHVIGALVVEIEDAETFHFRQIQADKHGGFVDLGLYVRGNSVSKMAPEALVLGDWHSGETDPVAAKCWEDVSDALKVKRWIIHDGFSGESVNHHNEGKLTVLAKQAEAGKLSLLAELTEYSKDLLKMLTKRDVVVVKSNHDEFLDRYLEGGRYVEHPYNHRLSLELAAAYLDGGNPVKHFFDKFSKKKPKHKITWLKRDESYKLANIELGAHGDKGANGARGSAASMENAYGPSISGHTHSPAINRDTWVVGTTSLLQLSYNVGPSSWFHTSCLVYPNGNRQLINSIDGKCTTRKLT